MKQGIYEIKENRQLTPSTYLMKLEGDITALKSSGQFINIKLDGRFLRRPISICDAEVTDAKAGVGIITIIYKILGAGTEDMSRLEAGHKLDVLAGLGNGYSLDEAGDAPLLIGGGVGIPPLYLAAKLLKKAGLNVTVILGFNSAEEIYFSDEFEALGCRVVLATADGSSGIRGFVTDAFKTLNDEDFTYFYCCGPEPMLNAIYDEVYIKAGIPGQMSFEERMGCGFGACMGCSCKTKNGYKRICREGPVLKADEIIR